MCNWLYNSPLVEMTPSIMTIQSISMVIDNFWPTTRNYMVVKKKGKMLSNWLMISYSLKRKNFTPSIHPDHKKETKEKLFNFIFYGSTYLLSLSISIT